MLDRAKGEGIVFLGGAPRSGLTLLRRMILANPHAVCGPDTGIAPAIAMQAADFRTSLGSLHHREFNLDEAAVQRIFGQLMARLLAPKPAGTAIIFEKTALNVVVFERLAELLPQAKFIHVVRDGRDVVSSLLMRDWRDPLSGAKFPHVSTLSAAANYWAGLAGAGLRAEEALETKRRILRMRYEDAVRAPEATLSSIFEFSGVDRSATRAPPDVMPMTKLETESAPEIFRAVNAGHIGAARKRLAPSAFESASRALAPVLSRLGYR